MDKHGPSFGKILAMAFFALSCFGILLFLWLQFGGPVPLQPQAYRLKANFPEAGTLAQEADVRMSGVNIGKVKQKALDKGGATTVVEMDINDDFAPIPADSRVILRQKTLLGETYVEITPGTQGGDRLADGGTLRRTQVEPTVELDEIFNSFDRPTRLAFREWVKGSAETIQGGRGEDLNDAFGNLEGFARDGAGLFEILDRQERALKGLVKNTGRTFGALNERYGTLQELIRNSSDTFAATASEREALAETFEVFPTFLDESSATLARLQTFSRNTNPLVSDLKPVADDLGPTIRDLGDLAPHLTRLFRELDPYIEVAERYLPEGERFIRGAEPVFESMHVFLPELNPILAYANYNQNVVAGFLTNGGGATNYQLRPRTDGSPRHSLAQFGPIGQRSMALAATRPPYERANAYIQPNTYARAIPLGIAESWDCKPNGGEQKDPVDDDPPCFVMPNSEWDGKKFNFLRKGYAPLKLPPPATAGSSQPDPNRPLNR